MSFFSICTTSFIGINVLKIVKTNDKDEKIKWHSYDFPLICLSSYTLVDEVGIRKYQYLHHGYDSLCTAYVVFFVLIVFVNKLVYNYLYHVNATPLCKGFRDS